jgi:hypothetical protein
MAAIRRSRTSFFEGLFRKQEIYSRSLRFSQGEKEEREP